MSFWALPLKSSINAQTDCWSSTTLNCPKPFINRLGKIGYPQNWLALSFLPPASTH